MPVQIPLDPVLPADFDDTPNDQRPLAQLDEWWDRPYGITRENGRIDVRCLNGGAWDRSTWLGQAANYEEACELAEAAQAKWLKFRSKPTFMMDSPKSALVIMPQRPDQDIRHLVDVDGPEQAAAYLREHFPEAIDA